MESQTSSYYVVRSVGLREYLLPGRLGCDFYAGDRYERTHRDDFGGATAGWGSIEYAVKFSDKSLPGADEYILGRIKEYPEDFVVVKIEATHSPSPKHTQTRSKQHRVTRNRQHERPAHLRHEVARMTPSVDYRRGQSVT